MKSRPARGQFSGAALVLLLLSCNGDSPTAPRAQPPAQTEPPAAATGVVSGFVLDPSGVCLPGAVVEVLDGARVGDKSTHKGVCGAWDYGVEGYSLRLPDGIKVRLRASKAGYRSKEETVLAPAGRADFVLTPE
ncbi:MAG: hypothetical protein M3041_14250 [Acidobacteriota bacterium]|nr:hypothetical protein [Acidobacteriota bacterium]